MATMACKAAVKAGDPLTSAEIEALLARRDLVERSSNCPHGRPTTLRLTLGEVADIVTKGQRVIPKAALDLGYVFRFTDVEAALKKSGIKEGLCLVNPMHISASVYINDDESGLLKDYDDFLERLVPHEPTHQYRHNDTGEDNADAHIKRQVMGREVVVAITNGKLDFGPWEQIFYGEFDGHRKKRVLVKIIGE